jgi:ATP-dependent DNA helicase RecQ
VNALVGYFGESRDEPCGHCSFCLGGAPQQLPEAATPPALDTVVDEDALAALQALQPDALRTARQCARYLCGIASPATSRARLTREPLFGVVTDRSFGDVLAWCERRPVAA